MAEVTNLQQILSMSGAVEKVQQVQQVQPVLQGEQFSASLRVKDDLKRTEVPATEKSDETSIREEYTERGGVKYRYIPKKTKSASEKKGEDARVEKAESEKEQGNIIDVTV
ncbi:MAG: hypothetical protein HY578_04270 [Nitrospinae bacterium]|nr:hypothetical protein [Nitrospinota bacterium]